MNTKNINPNVSISQNELSSILCDAEDLKDRVRAYNIKDKSKDSEDSKTTIGDCIDNIIEFLESLEREEL